MISDIVLLKELPKAIRNSVAAYIGCLSGAIMRDDYLERIEAAGFEEVSIVDETSFPLELMANDPTARALVETLGLPAEEVGGAISSVLSVSVWAVKPKGTA